MGQFAAGVAFVGILVYLIGMYVLTSSLVDSGINSAEINLTDDEQIQQSLDLQGGICEGPRERDTLFDSYNGLSCNSVPAAQSEPTCNEVEGCTWINESEGFLFLDSPATCEGTINASAYDSDPTIGASGNFLADPDFCAMDQLDERSCELLGCAWVQADEIDITVSGGFSTVTSTLGVLSGFRADIVGLEGMLAFVYAMVAFYIPIVLLVIAVYFMLPVIH